MSGLGDRFPDMRAERLRVLLAQLQGVPAIDAEEAISMTPLTPWGSVLAQAITDEDLALASAALNVEAELREEGWASLERLGALVAAGEGSLQERVLSLSGGEFAQAASCVISLGWLDR